LDAENALNCIKSTFLQGQQLKARLVNDVNEGLSFHKNIHYDNRDDSFNQRNNAQRVLERPYDTNNYYSIDRKLSDRSND